ncbi:putative ribonuclease H-like domain-containing protein [Tanacetum coccineum]
MIMDELLDMIVDESLDMIVDESFDMIVDESLMIEDKSLVKLVDETLKLDEEHFEFVIADCKLSNQLNILNVKLLMEAIEKRYGGNKESKKVQRTLLKQQYKNFVGSSSETMDQTFDRSLPSEWKTHALIWRNKEDIDIINLDDFYNNLNIYEPELTGSSNTSQNLQNVAFVSSNSTNSNRNSSTNEANNTTYGVSAAHTQSNPTSRDNLSDVVICTFLASQPNSPQLACEDLEQIDPDDLEEMDLQWEMAMLTIRARKFIKKTGRKLDLNGQRVGFDRGRENSRRTVTMETPTENALVAQDGIGGYDWSYQAEEEHPTNYALMAHTSSESSSSSDSEVDSCSKSCVKAYSTLKEHYASLSSNYKKSQLNLVSYKAFKLRDNALVENKKKLEKAEKERDELKLTLEKFQNSSKSLNNLLESQVSDKFKTRLGYNIASSTTASHAVEIPLPYTGNFIPSKPDLMFIDEKVESENMDVITVVTPSNVKKVESNHQSGDVKNNGKAVKPKIVMKNNFRPPVIEDWNSNDDSEVEFIPNVEVKTVRPGTENIKFVKSARETVEKVETSKQNKHYPRGNQRNCNNLMYQILGSDFKMINKACFVCGSFEHLHYVCDKKVIRPVWNNSSRVNHKNFANKMTHPHLNKRFVPEAVLTRSSKINTAGASVNTAVSPVNNAGSKTTVNHSRPIQNAYKKGYSQVTRPFNKYSENKNSIFNKKVNTVKVKETIAMDRVVASENKGKWADAVKASACWGNPPQKEYKEKGVIDSGFSRHMIGNECYLTEYEDYDGGFVSFGDGKGRISGKVLSSDFKLLDESQVLLRVPRKDNIYSVDLNSVVSTKGLTCLFTKATIDESNLWHRRLGYINFKNMNKLVRGNLVRWLPSKIFENDYSSVAYQKGKEHKASCKAKLVNSINKPLHMLHMDLFGRINVKCLMKKSYCLVVTDDFSRFSWVFFLATKDETSRILKTFITKIENQLDYKVKVIRSDNGTEFKNSVMNQFYEMKGIKREFSVTRTPQQNGVAERKNRTLIEVARTMLVNSKLPTTFWAKAVNTACYVLNRVLVIKPDFKTPYELILRRTPLIDFMKPFRCPVTILNTKDHLGYESIEKRKKQLAAERAEAIRNKPPTKTQLRNLMMTYLKNMGSYAAQKSPKKPKVMKSGKDVTKEEAAEYEKEKKELRLSLKIIFDDDSEVDYEPLSRKFAIVNWEYQLLGKMEEKDMYVYKLTRADGSSSSHGDTQALLRRLPQERLE